MLKIKDDCLIVKKEFRDKVKQILLDKDFDLFTNSVIKELIRCNCNTVELFYIFTTGLIGVNFHILNSGDLIIYDTKKERHYYRFLLEYCEETNEKIVKLECSSDGKNYKYFSHTTIKKDQM